jgi:biotin carboxyl carrier protein
MKMHNEVCAEIDGRVEEVAVEAGDRVEKGQLLVRLH